LLELAAPTPPWRGLARVQQNFSGTPAALGIQVVVVARVLVVEDDSKVARAVRDGLAAEGYEVHVASSGDEALDALRGHAFALIVLDLMLPGTSGLEVLATMRQAADSTPVLVLTARDTVGDRVAGLDAGADDYLVKPFAFAELVARVRALLRRSDGPARLSVGGLEVDPQSRRATRDGHVLALTAREFDLLEYLVRHQGQVVSRDQIARDVWREPSRGTPLDNVIDVHIMRLRRKVDPDASPRLIHTVRGVGFVVREDVP
jgi:two-component system, OmpR family, copper resistance phosphate regulon response regulator CusR